MNRFVRLKMHDALRDEYVERWFNVDAIRHIEPDTNKVLLSGAKSAMVVSTESMEELMQEVKKDAACQKSKIIVAAHLGRIETHLESIRLGLDELYTSTDGVGLIRENRCKQGILYRITQFFRNLSWKNSL